MKNRIQEFIEKWLAPIFIFCVIIFAAIVPNVLADSPQAGFRGSSSGAASNLAFVTIGNTAALSAERALATAASTRISITDGGANGSVTLDTGTNVPLINAGNSWSTAQIPSALGTIDLGSTTKAWRSIYLSPNGGSNYAVITPTTLTGNRTVNLPDANSTTVQADTGSSNNFLTAISAQGVISKAQPAFSNLSGNATVAQGGTGLTTLTAFNVLLGNGTSNVAFAAPGATGIPLISQGAASNPVFGTVTTAGGGTGLTGTPTNGQLPIGNGSGYTLATITQGTGITVTNGAGTITISATASGGSFTIATKTTSFTASDGASYYYRMTTNDQTVTLPASPADGSIRKFKMVTAGKLATFAFNGAETINHADGTSDQALTLDSTDGVIELTAVSGGWDET